MPTTRLFDPLPVGDDDIVSPEVDSVPPTRPLWSFDTKAHTARALAVDDELGLAAIGSSSGEVHVLDTSTGEHLARFLTDGFVWEVAFSADHQDLTAIGVQGQMHRWDWTAGAIVVDGVRPGNAAQNSRPALSADGSTVAIQQVLGIAVWDVPAMALRFRTEPLDALAGSLVIDAIGDRLLMTKQGRMGPPSRVYRSIDGAIAMLPRSDRQRSPAPPEPEVRVKLWNGAGISIPLPERLVAYRGRALCFEGAQAVVMHRRAMLDRRDLTTGSQMGPMLRCPGNMRSFDLHGNLVGMVGRGWFVLDRFTGAVHGGRSHPPSSGRASGRPLGIRLDPAHRIAVVSYSDGLIRAYRYRKEPSG
jgi:hypothetical protein